MIERVVERDAHSPTAPVMSVHHLGQSPSLGDVLSSEPVKK
jgi:hypothetical protein